MRWYEELDEKLRDYLPDLPVSAEEPLSKYTSFRIGGPARRMAFPRNAEQLVLLLNFAGECGARPYVLGNGTNVLFPDEGVDRLVISTRDMADIQLLVGGRVRAGAGASLARTAVFACQKGLAGLEFAHGIPGSVGGGVIMNAGAYDGELKDAVESVVFYYLPDQSLYEMPHDNCAFGYRTSFFQKTPGCVILSAVFRLKKGDGEAIAAKMRELNQRRRDKQPLDLPSAGSAFRRPENGYAAALIDEAGLKGYTVGGAQVSEKHAGFVVNTGKATSHDVYDLMMHIRKTVYEKSGTVLVPEMIILPPDYALSDNGPEVPLNRVTGGLEAELNAAAAQETPES